jgi:multidrug efflux pump subunit AcrB
MKISDIAVEQRVTVFVLTLIIAISGFASYLAMPLEAAPEVIIPNIFVSTDYRGVAADEIETLITKKIEEKLKGIKGVKEITSTSSEGRSEINVEFISGTDINQAELDVKDAVDRAKGELPTDLEDDPLVFDLNISEEPIFIFALFGKGSPKELRKFAEDLQERIEGIPGVLEVDVSGGQEREIHIKVDPARMALYGIDLTAVSNKVTSENNNSSGGSFRTNEGKYQLKLEGEFKTVSQAEEVVITTRADGSPVYLKDVAVIVDGSKDLDASSRINGMESVNLYVKKRSGENIVFMIDAVKQLLKIEKPSWPKGLDFRILDDRSKDVKNQVSDLENNLFTALILVIIVVFFSLGIRNALLVSVSIPLSMLGGFIVLNAFDITLNIVVLFALTLSLGMLVDNAIVITENIYRFMQNGMDRVQASKKATAEVAWAITGSCFTTLAAFVPLLWWVGVMGQFMIYLPITVITVLTSCLFVALIINPALAAVTMKFKRNYFEEQTEKQPSIFVRAYKRVLLYALGLNSRKKIDKKNKPQWLPRLSIIGFSFLTLVLSLSFWFYRVGMVTPVEFFPSVDPDRAEIVMEMPEGASLDYCNMLEKDVETRVYDKDLASKAKITPDDFIKARTLKTLAKNNGDEYLTPSDIPDVKLSYSAANSKGGNNKVTFMFTDIKDRTISSHETTKIITKRLKMFSGCEFTIKYPDHGPPTGDPVSIEISGPDMTVLGKAAKMIKGMVREVPFTKNIKDDATAGMPTISVTVNRKRAALVGLTSGDIGRLLNGAINGRNIDEFRQGDDDYDIQVRLDDKSRQFVETLKQLFIPTPSHGLVPLSTLVHIQYVGGMGKIKRKNHRRVVTVSADVDKEKTSGSAARMGAEKLLKASGLNLPSGYNIEFTGEEEEQKESSEFLTNAMLAAVSLIFFVLVAQFNSVVYPFIIICSVLLSFIGVFLGLAVFQMPFGIIMSGVGVISLAGVVVNNSIVMIEYILQLIDEGMHRDNAIVTACMTRLRPILLTATTTVLGLLPMVTGISLDFHPATMGIQTASDTTQMWQPMAVVVMFGLLVATFLTLIVVPVLFSLLDDILSNTHRAFRFIRANWFVLKQKYRKLHN